LRERRHDLFNADFQTELATMYTDSAVGQSPVPPAQLALATIVQAYTGVSDATVIKATVIFDLHRAAVVHNPSVWRQWDQQVRAA
jgi:hypothetical protein